MRPINHPLLFSMLLLLLASRAASVPQYDSPQLEIGIKPRTPQQIAAFYEARGFSNVMVAMLKQQCFLTIWIHNKSQNIIWLDLSRWQFSTASGTVTRLDRNYWKALWNKMQIPLAHQSTFRWTLLPEKLDFRPDEREGGNIILRRDHHPIEIQADFPTRVDQSGIPISVTIQNIKCGEDP